MKTKITGFLVIALLISGNVFSTLPVGKVPQKITLANGDGGKIDGTAWSSSELVNKVWVLVYADPDASDVNEAATEAIKAKDYPDQYYNSVAVINMAATWKPNFAINMILKGKQSKYPKTVYVRDMNRTLAKKWGIADESNDIVVFDPSGKVVFSHDGQLGPDAIKEMISILDAEIAKLK
ncbi:MAG TPA: transcriptional regulator [Bacteroidales bacterium]|jgi:predicted transcriptional regulator|nr:transcriptional regulator [Bacteroidales bacterium]